jgi:Ca2+-binding EF-hand superfamily protein
MGTGASKGQVKSPPVSPAAAGPVPGAATTKGPLGEVTVNAGVASLPVASTPAAAAIPEDDWNLHFVSLSEAVELIESYSSYIFARADSDGDGALRYDDFLALVKSATLDLGLEDKAAKKMFKGASNGQGVITLKEFVPLMRDLMSLHGKKRKGEKKSDWQWYCMYLDDSASALPVYYNIMSDQMTYDRPACIEAPKQAEEESDMRDFQQMIRISDGAIFTSFVTDDGVRMYLDWDTGAWAVFPTAWLDDFVIEAGQDHFYNDDPWADEFSTDALERFRHPITAREFETSVEDGRRLIFDDREKQWVAIPVMLEAFVPSVVR